MQNDVKWEALTLGQRVRKLRERLGKEWNQTKVAGIAKIKQPTLSNIERDKTGEVMADTLVGLARALKTNPNFLVSGRGSMAPDALPDEAELKPKEALFLEYFRGLSSEQQDEVLGPLKAAAQANAIAQKELSARLKLTPNARVEQAFGLPGKRKKTKSK